MPSRGGGVLIVAFALLVVAGCGGDGSGQTGDSSGSGERERRADVAKAPKGQPAKPQPSTPVRGEAEAVPRACSTQGPPNLVINRGDVSCDEARTLIGNARGPNEAEGPRGWDCSKFPRSLKGQQLLGADGFQCVRGDDAVSIIAVTAPPPAARAADRAFKSKSGNISCEITNEVRCDIAEKSWPSPPKPASCVTDYGPYLGVGPSGRGKHLCVGGAINQGRALAYGETVSRSGFECNSTEDRMRCENATTGHGFELSREAARLF